MLFLFHAHSGLRYLVLLAAVLAILYLAFGWLTRRPFDAPARILTASFTGLLDLQVVFGILLLFFRPFYPALTGHVMMMVFAAIAAHGLGVAGKKQTDPHKRYGITLAGVVLALALIVGGILAIREGVFQTSLS